MKKIKVLFMINSLGLGGAEKSLISLLQLLNYEKFEVDLQMMNFGGIFENLLPKEVHILPDLDYSEFSKQSFIKQICSFNLQFLFARFHTTLSLLKNNKSGHNLHDAQAYWRGCKNAYGLHPNKYDVAIAWGQGTPTHYVASKVRAVKKYAWINANYELAGHNKEFDREYYAVYDKNICVSNELATLFKKVFPEYADKLEVILDIKNPNIIMSMSQAQIQLPKSAQVTIVTVGRYNPQKNYLLALEAAVELQKRGLNFVWYAVGEGPDRKVLEQKIEEYDMQERFILLGAKSNPYPYIKAADVYVQTSAFEGYCLTLAEARMLNKPCVTTNFDVVYEQIIQRENGLVVEMNPIAVADGIIEILDNEILRNHIIEYLKKEKKGNIEEIKKVEALLEDS